MLGWSITIICLSYVVMYMSGGPHTIYINRQNLTGAIHPYHIVRKNFEGKIIS